MNEHNKTETESKIQRTKRCLPKGQGEDGGNSQTGVYLNLHWAGHQVYLKKLE